MGEEEIPSRGCESESQGNFNQILLSLENRAQISTCLFSFSQTLSLTRTQFRAGTETRVKLAQWAGWSHPNVAGRAALRTWEARVPGPPPLPHLGFWCAPASDLLPEISFVHTIQDMPPGPRVHA